MSLSVSQQCIDPINTSFNGTVNDDDDDNTKTTFEFKLIVLDINSRITMKNPRIINEVL